MHAYAQGEPIADIPVPTHFYSLPFGDIVWDDETTWYNEDPVDACTVQAFNGPKGGWALRWEGEPYNSWFWRDPVATNNIQYIIDVFGQP
jgi:hypothetical protein